MNRSSWKCIILSFCFFLVPLTDANAQQNYYDPGPPIQIVSAYLTNDTVTQDTVHGTFGAACILRLVVRDVDNWINFKPYWETDDEIANALVRINGGDPFSAEFQYIGDGKYEMLYAFSATTTGLIVDFNNSISVEINDKPSLADDSAIYYNFTIYREFYDPPSPPTECYVHIAEYGDGLTIEPNGYNEPLCKSKKTTIGLTDYYGTMLTYSVMNIPPTQPSYHHATVDWTITRVVGGAAQGGFQLLTSQALHPTQTYILFTQPGVYTVTADVTRWIDEEESDVVGDPIALSGPSVNIYSLKFLQYYHNGNHISHETVSPGNKLFVDSDTQNGVFENRLEVHVETYPPLQEIGKVLLRPPSVKVTLFDIDDPATSTIIDSGDADNPNQDPDGDGVYNEKSRLSEGQPFYTGESADNVNAEYRVKQFARHILPNLIPGKPSGTIFNVDVPKNPGDNFVLVCSSGSDISTAAAINPAGNPGGTYFDDYSNEFTIWRKLYFEMDHMQPPAAGTFDTTTSSISGIVGNTITDSSADWITDELRGAVITIPLYGCGAHPARTNPTVDDGMCYYSFVITGNTANTATVQLYGNDSFDNDGDSSVDEADEQAVSLGMFPIPVAYKLNTDDKLLIPSCTEGTSTIFRDPYLNISLFTYYLQSVYVEPVRMPDGAGSAQFVRNRQLNCYAPVGVRDTLRDNSAFRVVHIVGSFEGPTDDVGALLKRGDGDPDLEITRDSSYFALLGHTPVPESQGCTADNKTSMIFLETIADIARHDGSIEQCNLEQLSVIHEAFSQSPFDLEGLVTCSPEFGPCAMRVLLDRIAGEENDTWVRGNDTRWSRSSAS